MKLEQTFTIMWRILQALATAPDGISISEVSRTHQISRGAVNKYMHILEGAGIPIYIDRKRYYIDQSFFVSFDLTADESEFLYLALERSIDFHAARWSSLQSLLHKLGRKMPQLLGNRLTAKSGYFVPDTDQWFKQLAAAKRDRREVWVNYHPLNRAEPSRWLIRPLRFTSNSFSDGLYVQCEGTQDSLSYIPLSLKFDRILGVQPTQNRFEISALTRFSLHDGTAWGVWHSHREPTPVVLRFEPRHYDRLLETTWHETQTIATDATGYVTFTVRVSEPDEMISWIRSWGSGVVIIEPEKLRQRMIATLKRQLQAYGLHLGEPSTTAVTGNLWAKYDRRSGEYHRLDYHLLDVAAVAWRLWAHVLSAAQRQWLAILLNTDEEAAGRLLAFLAGLHDIGKATPEFQRKAAPLYAALTAAGLPDQHEGEVQHGILSAVILHKLLVEQGVSKRPAQIIAAAIGGHHGEFIPKDQVNVRKNSANRVGWSALQADLFNALQTVLQVEVIQLPEDPAQYNVLAAFLGGFISVCDWIGSNDTYFPYETQEMAASTYFDRALEQAELALAEMGWFGWQKPHNQPVFEEIFRFSPKAFQQSALEICLAEAAPPRLILIEYLTGGGKTELALYLADWLANIFDQAGTYVAMPTQATSNQMFERVSQYLQARYPHQAINVQLSHAQADQHPLYQEMHSRPEREGDDELLRVARWFQNRKRSLLAPFAVGTVDQAMLSVLTVQHHFVRQFALSYKTIIFDEVHAYDTYMNTIIERLLQWLNALHAPIILLSATLPATTRQQLIQQVTTEQSLEVVPYPRLTLVDHAGQVRVHALPAPPTRVLHLAFLPPALESLIEPLIAMYQAGGCIAVICNTVDEAILVANSVLARAEIDPMDVLVFHARFPMAWRASIEQKVLTRFGKHGKRPVRAIVIATQIIEQSLDLDFDAMITSVAPIDLLIQRAGRLHRHDRDRPDHLQTPTLIVRMPNIDANDIPHFGVDEVIYQRFILLRTWWVLHERDQLLIPDDIDTLMDAVYSDTETSDLPAAYVAALQIAHEKMTMDETRLDFRGSQDRIGAPDNEWTFSDKKHNFSDDDTAAPTTRDIRPGVDIVCLGADGNKQKLPLLPAHTPTRAEIAHLLRFAITVRKTGAKEALEKLPVEKTWERLPQLRFVRPVIFTGETYRVPDSRYTLRLTKTFGLEILEENE